MGYFTSPVTGPTTITGLTSPTYTLTDDTAPDVNGKQQAVTALGGTQAGVLAHSNAAPFTLTVYKPKNVRSLGVLDAITGAPKGSSGRNLYSVLVRKGMLPLAGQPYQIGTYKSEMSIPAGADLADAANVKAMIALGVGAQFTDANKLATLGTTGVFT